MDDRAGQEVDRQLHEPTVPTGEGAGQSVGPYLWDPGSQEGGCVLGQAPRRSPCSAPSGRAGGCLPVSAQLLKQVCDQVVPLPALVDQGSQLGLKGWE